MKKRSVRRRAHRDKWVNICELYNILQMKVLAMYIAKRKVYEDDDDRDSHKLFT